MMRGLVINATIMESGILRNPIGSGQQDCYQKGILYPLFIVKLLLLSNRIHLEARALENYELMVSKK